MSKNDYLYKSFLMLKTEDEVKKYLRDLLTTTEINEFADRLWIAKMLDQKYMYSEITDETKASSRTIARVSKWLRGELGGYRLVLGRIDHLHKTTQSRL